jgi:hypothetical protein
LHIGEIVAALMEMANFRPSMSVGTDIVEVERLRVAVKRFGNSFLAKIFTKTNWRIARVRLLITARWQRDLRPRKGFQSHWELALVSEVP